MNTINYDNTLWCSVPIEREYKFYYKDYTKEHKGRVIRIYKGTIFDFLKFSHYITNIILCKVEEYDIFENYINYEMCRNRAWEHEEKQQRIVERKSQKTHTFSKTNNNWNFCKNYNKRFR